MSGPKRNPDKLNTIGVVVVGICGAVLVYVTIVALQAFYMNDTSDLMTAKDYGGMEQAAKGHKADEMRNITDPGSNPSGTFRIPIDVAMQLVVRDAANDPSHLVPALPPATKPTIEPAFGRPKPIGGPAPTEGAGSAAPAGAGAGSAAPTGAGSAAGAGSGAAAAPANGNAGAAAPQTPTGATRGPTGAGASPSKDATPSQGSAAPHP